MVLDDADRTVTPVTAPPRAAAEDTPCTGSFALETLGPGPSRPVRPTPAVTTAQPCRALGHRDVLSMPHELDLHRQVRSDHHLDQPVQMELD
ncbi:hypothetical protein ACFQ6V_13070 [Streptomyces roseifaciens]